MSRYHAAAFFLMGVFALLVECLPSLAAEAAAKSRKNAEPAFDPSAMDKRIADSKHVFVGEGVRIYFVDRRYRETPYIRAAGDGSHKSAMLVVKVVKVLHPSGAGVPSQVLVPIATTTDAFGVGRSPYDREVEQHVGKRGIWLGEIVVRKDYGDDRSGRKPLEEPVTLLQVAGDAKKRGSSAPLPMKHLKEVTESIARVSGGGEKAAAMKTEQ